MLGYGLMHSRNLSIKENIGRIPLLKEAWWSLNYAMHGNVRPHDGLIDISRAMFTALSQQPGEIDHGDQRRIVVFSSSCLSRLGVAMSTFLASRGCRVSHLWLPDFCKPTRAAERFTKWADCYSMPHHPLVQQVDLRMVEPLAKEFWMEDVATTMARRKICNRNEIDGLDQGDGIDYSSSLPEDVDWYVNVLRKITSFLSQHEFDSAVTVAGNVLSMGCFYETCKERELPCVTFEFGERSHTHIIAAKDWPVCEWRTDDIWSREHNPKLNTEEETEVEDHMAKRELPTVVSGSYSMQTSPPLSAEETRSQLGLDPSKTTALLCTNLLWDSALLDKHVAFSSMMRWCVQTIEWFAARPRLQLVIRTHPVEAQVVQKKSVVDRIRHRFPTLPSNVRCVPHDSSVNTYGVAKACDVVLVYASTIGMELAARGMPVIVAGKVHYARHGFTLDPDSVQQYFQLLEQQTSGPMSLDDRTKAIARSYYHAYFFHFELPFPPLPCGGPGFPGTLEVALKRIAEKLPLSEKCPYTFDQILRGEGQPEWFETLDFVAGRIPRPLAIKV